MDPNANLAEQEEILHYQKQSLIQTSAQRRHRNTRLSDLRQALYDWIRDGGFEPDWSLAPTARKYYGR